jgi:hypothetical protein
MITSMARTRKSTIEVTAELLRKAQKQPGEGVTATVRQGLELPAAVATYTRHSAREGEVLD